LDISCLSARETNDVIWSISPSTQHGKKRSHRQNPKVPARATRSSVRLKVWFTFLWIGRLEMPSLQLVQLVTIRSSSYRKGSCGIEDWSRKRLVSELGSARFDFDPPMNLGSRSTYVILSSPLSSVRIACFLPSQRASPLITIAIFGKEAVYLQEYTHVVSRRELRVYLEIPSWTLPLYHFQIKRSGLQVR
jgi:hypothetical protein